MLRFELPEVDVEIDCGSGTYIRAIARDVGEALGVGGHLSRLRRTRVGEHSVEGAVPLEALDDPDRVGAALLSPAEALRHLPRVVAEDDQVVALRHGRAMAAEGDLPPGRPLALLSEEGELIAVGERTGAEVRPRKVFA
jgi:tRNA pseudouridine55 synthase